MQLFISIHLTPNIQIMVVMEMHINVVTCIN